MRFDEAYQGWSGGRLTQAEAAMLLGQCERGFRRHVERYRADGLQGLLDKRLSQVRIGFSNVLFLPHGTPNIAPDALESVLGVG